MCYEIGPIRTILKSDINIVFIEDIFKKAVNNVDEVIQYCKDNAVHKKSPFFNYIKKTSYKDLIIENYSTLYECRNVRY